MKYRSHLTTVFCSIALVFICSSASLSVASEKFYAVGTSEPVVKYLEKPSSAVPRQLRKVAVEVHFDLVPTMMRFSMPCYPCMVTENDIHYSNGWTETYARRWRGPGVEFWFDGLENFGCLARMLLGRLL